MSCGRVKAIHAVAGTHVNISIFVFGDNFGEITRQSLRGRISSERGTRGDWIIQAHQSATSRSQPDSPRVIHVDVLDCAGRQSIPGGEEGAAALTIARKPRAKTDPDVACSVFAERARQFIFERR